MTKRLLLTLTLFVVASFSAPLLSAAHHKGGHADRVFEYRVYTVNPGKMPNLGSFPRSYGWDFRAVGRREYRLLGGDGTSRRRGSEAALHYSARESRCIEGILGNVPGRCRMEGSGQSQHGRWQDREESRQDLHGSDGFFGDQVALQSELIDQERVDADEFSGVVESGTAVGAAVFDFEVNG